MGYIKTRFKISNSYSSNKGWTNKQEEEKFNEEIRAIFESMGWTVDKNLYCARLHYEKLNLHPLSFSGVVMEESIALIKEKLAAATTFKFCSVQTFDRYYVMTDTEYLLKLRAMREDMIIDILKGFKTKRADQFVMDSESVYRKMEKKYRIPRIGNEEMEDPIFSGIYRNLFGILLSRGELVEKVTKNGKGYRTMELVDKKSSVSFMEAANVG